MGGDHGAYLRRGYAVRLRGTVLSIEERVGAADAGAAASAGDAECGVFAGRAGFRGENCGFSVHDVCRYRGRAAAYCRYGGARTGGGARGWRIYDVPCGVPTDTGGGGGLLRALRGADGGYGERRFLHGGEGEVFILA